MNIEIGDKKIEAREGETILSAAKRNGINVPYLCFHSDLKNKASCRVCVVEINGELLPACKTKVEEGMKVEVRSAKAEKARKLNLELLFSQHQEECFDCIWNLNCKMLDLAKEYGVEINRFIDRKSSYPNYHFGASLEYDSSKCIDCRNCIEVCEKQGVGYLEIRGKGHLLEVFPSEKKEKDCIYCGQCIVHCPAGAFEAVGEFEEIESPFEKTDKKIVFQIAPSVRVTIGEEFGLPYGSFTMGKIVNALKRLGGGAVFDVSSGADITTIEESKEFLEKAEKDDFPMLTACCPAWVRFVEFYYPQFIPNLTTVRSPHIILGALIKDYYQKNYKADYDDVYVVSVMPCVAKKSEIEREELFVEGRKAVDYVMTTRELARLIKRKKIDFANLEDGEVDDPFGKPSGSGVSYGVSGGVMSSAYHNITGEEAVFKNIEEGVREANVNYNGKEIKLAVLHGLGKGRDMLEEMKDNPKKYDYVEVMACPGGCIGGGGQSVPFDKEIREKRSSGLCSATKKSEIRKAQDNPETQNIYQEHLKTEEKIAKFCYTHYSRKYKSPVCKKQQGEKNEK